MKENDYSEMLPLKSTLQGGKYRIDAHIGSGGFGNTYEVMNVEFEERMALKEFFMKGISEREEGTTTVSVSNLVNKDTFNSQKEKFKKEARRLRKLHNLYIVQVHDLFEENGTAYYAMDYIDGESLSTRLKSTKKPLTEAETMNILRQVLDALSSVHSQRIWHLDLKPGNIMVDKEGRARLIDFGASKQMSASEGEATTTTSMCYTPGYAPTEQIEQKMELIGPWTDLYALGGTLYNLLTCNQPPSISEMQEKDAFKYTQEVSEKTQYLIRWLMTPSRHKRPQSVDEVKKFLDRPFVAPKPQKMDEITEFGKARPKEEKPQPPKPDLPVSDNNMPMSWIIAGVVAILLIIGVVVYFSNSSDKNDSVVAEQNQTEAGKDSTKVSAVAESAVKKVFQRYFKSALGVCSYSGEIDDNELPHGIGEASFTDGRLYKGQFVHGVMQGDDAYFRYDNGDTFEGTFTNNTFSKGKYTMKEDGSYFVGSFKNGQPSEGTWYDKNGKKI